jgi:hypothetical protein
VSLSGATSAEQALDWCIEAGARQVVVKLGARGALAYIDGQQFSLSRNESIWSMQPVPVIVLQVCYSPAYVPVKRCHLPSPMPMRRQQSRPPALVQ